MVQLSSLLSKLLDFERIVSMGAVVPFNTISGVELRVLLDMLQVEVRLWSRSKPGAVIASSGRAEIASQESPSIAEPTVKAYVWQPQRSHQVIESRGMNVVTLIFTEQTVLSLVRLRRFYCTIGT